MKILFATVAILISTTAFSQNIYDVLKTDARKSDRSVYVEQMPEYPGGETALLTYLQTNVEYPDSARLKNAEGCVQVGFVVEVDGNVKDVVVERKVNPWLDEEAVRVVKAMPNWKAGVSDGKPVPVYYRLPICFSLH